MADKYAGLMFKLAADSTQLVTGMNQAKSSLRSVQKTNSMLQKSFAALGPTIVAAFSVRKITGFVKSITQLYDIQAKAEAGLLTALEGREDIQKRLMDQASDLQRITLFGDEETIAAQRMLAVMGLEEGSIRKLIPLIQDLATAKKMDLVGAADLVAKSVGSSTNALSRYGIEITGAVGSAERLTSAVNALSEMFEGQAKAAAEAGTGGLKQLSNTWGDIKEQLGELFTEALKVNERAKMLSETLMNATAPENFKQSVGKMKGALIALEPILVATIGHFWVLWKAVQGVKSGFDWAKDLFNKSDAKKFAALVEEFNAGYPRTAKGSGPTPGPAKKTVSDIVYGTPKLDSYFQGTPLPSGIPQPAINIKKPEIPKIDLTPALATFKELPEMFNRVNAEIEAALGRTMGIIEVKFNDMNHLFLDWQSTTRDIFMNVADTLAGAIETAFAGGTWENVMQGAMKSFGAFLKQMGGMYLAYGIANSALIQALKNPTNPVSAAALIAAGATMLTLGAMISGAASGWASRSGFGSQSGSSGVSQGGGYSQTDTTPVTVEINGQLRGHDIYWSNKNYSTSLNS